MDEKDLVYWFHASSHGEFEQIKPVLDGIKNANPRIKVLLSFFSPSGYDNVKDDLVDCKLYIPFDFYFTTKKVFEIINKFIGSPCSICFTYQHLFLSKECNHQDRDPLDIQHHHHYNILELG